MRCPQEEFIERMRLLTAEFDACRPLLIALGDANRQCLILALMGNPAAMRVGELAERSNLSRPAVSHHLKILREAGVVRVHREGTKNYYYMNGDEAQWARLTSLMAHVSDIVQM